MKKLIIIAGLPGTGKTTVAKMLAKILNIPRLSTDDIRKEKGFSIRKKYGDKPYPENHKKRTYDIIFDLAEDLLRKGKSVILDATFYARPLREKAFRLAEDQKAKFFIIEVIAQANLVVKRIEKRYKKGADSSEANKRIYFLHKAKFEPIRENKLIIINNSTLKNLEQKVKELASNI
jgi:hypothetical protein